MGAPHEHRCAACGIDRRTFLSQSTLAAVTALLVEACGTGVWDPVSPQSNVIPATGLTYPLANYPALATVVGIAKVVDPSGVPLALVRTGASTFTALSLVCPHQGTTVNVSGSGFLCPNHGARFAADGTWTGGQATANLTSYPVTYNATTGVLTVAAPKTTTPATPVANGSQLLVTLANVPALDTVGGIARVDGNTSKPVALVRTGPATYVALSMVCPHQGATISVQSGGFTCPRHGARFSSDGTWLSGQRTSNLQTLPSKFDAVAGTVTITISGSGTSTGSGGGRDP
jgi:Rieske Fe-S protein